MQTPLLYPLRGILFLSTHKLLLKQGWKVGKYAGASAAALAALFYFTFNLQYSIVASILGKGGLGLLATSVAILVESSVPMWLVVDRLQGGVREELFDDVLASYGVTKVRPLPASELEEIRLAADAYRQQHQKSASWTSMQGLLGLAKKIVLRSGSVQGWTNWAMSSVLLMLGPVGWVVYLLTNGTAAGAECHRHYFRKKGLTKLEEQEVIVRSRASQYMRFGAMVTLLNLIPLANWTFSLSSAAGAAMWAADLEQSEEKLMQGNVMDSLGDIKAWAGKHVDTEKVAQLIDGKAGSTVRKFNDLRETLFTSPGSKAD